MGRINSVNEIILESRSSPNVTESQMRNQSIFLLLKYKKIYFVHMNVCLYVCLWIMYKPDVYGCPVP